MNELVPDRLDDLMTRSAMAKEAGISATTLVNWEKREPAALATIEASSGDAMHTWRHLLDFCTNNPNLSGTRKVIARYRQLFPGDSPDQHRDRLDVTTVASATLAPVLKTSSDGATLRSAFEDLKTEVHALSDLVASTARLAAEASSAHARLLRRLEALEAKVASVPHGGVVRN